MPWAAASTCTGASREPAWPLPETHGGFLLPVVWPHQRQAGCLLGLSSTAMTSPFGSCPRRSVLISDLREVGERSKGLGLRDGSTWSMAGTPRPRECGWCSKDSGPFNFSITCFPLVSRVLVTGVPLPGRHGRGVGVTHGFFFKR